MSETHDPQPQAPDRGGFLEGQMLIAMPSMGDPRFERTVIYLCAHSEAHGAMGLVINKLVSHITFPQLLEQLEIVPAGAAADMSVHFGGPVETGRGFVLHSADFHLTGATSRVSDEISVTASVEILTAIARGDGPAHSLLALGYAGWAPGQLEAELSANGWLHCPADLDLVFGRDVAAKWPQALAKLGVEASHLSGTAGHA